MNPIGAHLRIDPYHATGILRALEQAKALKLKHMQLFLCDTTEYFAGDQLGELEYVGREAKAAEIGLTVHHCYVTNPAYEGEQKPKFKLALKSLSEMMKLCDRLQATNLVVHCGSHKEAGPQHGIQKMVEATKYILDKGYRTRLCWENGAGGGTQTGHLSNVFEVLSNFWSPEKSNIGLCLDTAHLFADGVDIREHLDSATWWIPLSQWLCAMHWNSPDPKVQKGNHLDRHTLPWAQCHFSKQDMLAIASAVSTFVRRDVPLIMEASVPGAYEANLRDMGAIQ